MENHPFLVGKLSINAPFFITMVYIVSLKKIETCQIRFLWISQKKCSGETLQNPILKTSDKSDLFGIFLKGPL